MKRLFLFSALLCAMTIHAQAQTTNRTTTFQEDVASLYELFFGLGFKLGLEDSEYGVDNYFLLIKSVSNVNPREYIHNEFEYHIPKVDPDYTHKRITRAMLSDYLVGKNRDFTIGFVFSGYLAAAMSVDATESLEQKYGVNGMFQRCKAVYLKHVEPIMEIYGKQL